MIKQTEKFLRYLQFEKRASNHTIISYRKDLEQFFAFLDQQYKLAKLEEITHFYVRSWIVSLMDAKQSSRTVNRKISALKSFFRFMIKEQVLEANPMQQVVSPKIPKRIPEYVQSQGMEILFGQVEFGSGYSGLRNRLILEILYATGMRRSELSGLKMQHINFNQKTIKVLGKRNKERIIPMTDALVGLLKKYETERQDVLQEATRETDAVILDDRLRDADPGFIYRIVKKYLSQVTTIGKKSPHALRHTFATHLLNNGADINAIKELLGHASLAATQVYTHNSVEKLKQIHRQAHPKA